MPRIFENIGKELLPALQKTIKLSDRVNFCIGYFNKSVSEADMLIR